MSTFEIYRNLFTLTGKVALVAGGAGGIGAAVCESLASFGATVIVGDYAGEKAEALAAAINTAGGNAWGGNLNALDCECTRQFAVAVVKKFGRLDALVNCVGTHVEARAEDFTEQDWDRVFNVNLKAAFFLSQAVANVQIPQGGGKQIHVSSVRSALGIHRGYVAYCASKGGMNMMIKQLATEWAKHKITVNGIAPTFVKTDLVKSYLDDPNFYQPLVARIPLGRVAEPLDVAALATYLVMPAADFITGQIIFADGGVTACQ